MTGSHPGRTALVLAVASFVVLFGGLYLFDSVRGGANEDAQGVVVILAVLVWIAAAASQIRGADPSAALWMTASVLVYGVAFFLPAADSGETQYAGRDAYISALALRPHVWLANPAYVLAMVQARRGADASAAGLAALAIGFGLLVFPSIDHIQVREGFYLWLSAPAIVGLASVARAIRRRGQASGN